MVEWHKQLGFKSYPLDPRSNTQLVGVDEIESQLIQYIRQGNMCLLSGPTGSGKTSMLKRLVESSDLSDLRFVYVSADGLKREYDAEDLLKNNTSIWQKITLQKPRNMVILLDECHIASRNFTESLKSKWNIIYDKGDKCIQSVVVCQIESRLGTNFSGSFVDRLGQRILRMPKLSKDELRQVLKLRLQAKSRNYLDAFSHDALDFLVFNADGSVRQLLEYADAIFRSHQSFGEKNPLLKNDYRISKEAVFNALQMSGLVLKEKESSHTKYIFKQIEKSKKHREAVEMFEQFGALSPVLLAEKMDVAKKDADSIITQLKKWDALVFSHEENDQKHYVLSPRVQHELIRA